MKIKLVILDSDKGYLNRVVSGFSAMYADSLEIHSFSVPQSALAFVHENKVDVLLASDSFDIDTDELPSRCAFAYLVDSPDITAWKDHRTICKFRKSDQIYKQIIGIYAENASSIIRIRPEQGKSALIGVASASGGVGSSSIAAACALHLAAKGKKTLYLNLERFGSSDAYFSGQGQFSMTDVIYALLRGKGNLALKLESCVRQDPRGVYFYAAAQNSVEMLELTNQHIITMLKDLQHNGGYEYIVVDMDFDIDADSMEQMRLLDMLILVGNGTEESNQKTERAYHAIEILESKNPQPLSDRILFIYNAVSSTSGLTVSIPGLRVLGGTHRYSGGSKAQLLEKLSIQDLFDKIS